MPWYEYTCENGHDYSENRSIYDGPKAIACPLCDSKLIRKFSAPPITFNGNGFNAKSG